MSLYVDKLSVESIGTKWQERGKPKKNVVLSSYCSSDSMRERNLIKFLNEFEEAHHEHGCRVEMSVKFISNNENE
jgi:hypothetical protein